MHMHLSEGEVERLDAFEIEGEGGWGWEGESR